MKSMNEKKNAVLLKDFTNAEEWVHDFNTVIDGEKCNELRQ